MGVVQNDAGELDHRGGRPSACWAEGGGGMQCRSPRLLLYGGDAPGAIDLESGGRPTCSKAKTEALHA